MASFATTLHRSPQAQPAVLGRSRSLFSRAFHSIRALFQIKGTAVAVSGDYVCNGSEACIRVNTGGQGRTLTLPPASNGPQFVAVEKVDGPSTAQIEVFVPVGDLYQGSPPDEDSTSVGPAQWHLVMFWSDGATNWTRIV